MEFLPSPAKILTLTLALSIMPGCFDWSVQFGRGIRVGVAIPSGGWKEGSLQAI